MERRGSDERKDDRSNMKGKDKKGRGKSRKIYTRIAKTG